MTMTPEAKELLAIAREEHRTMRTTVVVENGFAVCPTCYVPIKIQIDGYESLVRKGGCQHVVSDGFLSSQGIISVEFRLRAPLME